MNKYLLMASVAIMTLGIASESWATKCIGSTGQWNDGSGSCSTCGANCDWEIDGGTLKITGSGTMKGYDKAADQPWNSQKDNITAVSVSGVDNVGYRAFQNLDKTTSVTLSDSVKEVEHRAFWGTALTSANLNKVETLGDYAFQDASSLQSVDMPNVTSIGQQAFSYARSLQSVDMPNVTSIGDWAFEESSLQSVDMPNVTTIGNGAFYDAYSLQSVDMPKVTSIGHGAFGYTSLQSVDMPNVTSIGREAFRGAGSLQSVDMSNVTTIGDYAFIGAESLQSVDMPNVTSIGEGAFYEATSLQSVDMPNVTSIGQYAFYGARSLQSVDMPNVTEIGYAAFEGATSLSYAGFDPEKVTYIGYIGDDAFSGTEIPDCTDTGANCGSCGNNYIMSGLGCVADCGAGYLGKDGRCINSSLGCGAGYKDMGGFCNRIRYTPAEAAKWLKDDDNSVTITFKK